MLIFISLGLLGTVGATYGLIIGINVIVDTVAYVVAKTVKISRPFMSYPLLLCNDAASTLIMILMLVMVLYVGVSSGFGRLRWWKLLMMFSTELHFILGFCEGPQRRIFAGKLNRL